MVNTNDAGRQATDTERTSEEMKWTVAYTHYHLEDKTDEAEHDIGAASALEALLDFIDINTSVTPDEEVQESNLQLEEPSAFNGTVRELAQAFVNGDSPLAFWVSDMDIWHIFSVEQETTEDCSACGGRGRVQTRHPDTDEPVVCQLHPDGEPTKDGRCLVCETDVDELAGAAPQMIYEPCQSGNHGDCVVTVGENADGIAARCACPCHQASSRQRVVMADVMLPDPTSGGVFWEQDAVTVAEHDDEGAEPHSHYSIVAIEGGRVVDIDWGYHSEDEARARIPATAPPHYDPEDVYMRLLRCEHESHVAAECGCALLVEDDGDVALRMCGLHESASSALSTLNDVRTDILSSAEWLEAQADGTESPDSSAIVRAVQKVEQAVANVGQPPATPKVLALIDGGLAEFVIEGNVTVRVIDYDIEGIGADEQGELVEIDGRQAFTGATFYVTPPDNFAELWEKAGQ